MGTRITADESAGDVLSGLQAQLRTTGNLFPLIARVLSGGLNAERFIPKWSKPATFYDVIWLSLVRGGWLVSIPYRRCGERKSHRSQEFQMGAVTHDYGCVPKYEKR
jgi:hypothetical protein